MGYRSDVALLIHFSSTSEPEKAFADYRQFKKYVTTKLTVEVEDASTPHIGVIKQFGYADLMEGFPSDDGECYLGWNDDLMVFAFNMPHVKWYGTYPDVRFLEQVIEYAADIYLTTGSRFVRYGEDPTDTDITDHSGSEYDAEDCYLDMLRIERVYDFSLDREQLTKEVS